MICIAVAGVRREMASRWRTVYESIVHQDSYAREHNSAAEQNTGGGVEIALPGFFGDPGAGAVSLLLVCTQQCFVFFYIHDGTQVCCDIHVHYKGTRCMKRSRPLYFMIRLTFFGIGEVCVLAWHNISSRVSVWKCVEFWVVCGRGSGGFNVWA